MAAGLLLAGIGGSVTLPSAGTAPKIPSAVKAPPESVARTASSAGGVALEGATTLPYLVLDPPQAGPGQVVLVYGRNFCPTRDCGLVTVTQDGAAVAEKIEVAEGGAFTTRFAAASAFGPHEIAAAQAGKSGSLRDAKVLIVGKVETESSRDEEPKQREYFPPPPPSDLPRPETALATEFQPNIGWGGRAVAIDVSPADASEAWAAAESGGLFKTTNGGANWSHYANTGQFRMFDVKYVGASGQRVIATSFYDSRAVNQGGILLTGDGGASWYHPASAEVTCFGVTRAAAYGIAYVASANEVYVGTDCGLAISRDGGNTWTHVSNWSPSSNPGTHSVTARPGVSGSIVDICGQYGHRRSINGGVSWTTSTTLPGVCGTGEVHAIATSPIESNVLLATTFAGGVLPCPVVLNDHRVFESDDGGLTWTPISAQWCPNRPTFVFTHLSRDNNPTHFDAYIGDGVNMPRQTCLSGGPGLRCAPGGWINVTLSHADPNGMAWGPSGNCPKYVVNDGGPSTTADCGATWTAVGGGNAGFHALQLYEVANQIHPGATDVYFGTQDNSLWASSDSGATWTANTCCEGFFLQMARNTPVSAGQTIAYVACGPCSNGGSGPLFSGEYNWNNPPGGGGNPVYVAAGVYLQWSVPSAPTSTVSQLYLTTNTGGLWTPVAGATIAESLWGLPLQSGAAANPTLIQAFQRAGGGLGLRRIVNTRSGSPAVSADRFPAGDVFFYCMGQGTFVCPAVFGVNPADPNHIIVADKVSGVMKVTRNGGGLWETDFGLTDLIQQHGQKQFLTRNAILQPHVIQWDPANTSRIYVSTDEAGTIASFDSGATWARLNQSTGIVNGSNFAFDEARGRVLAASYGRGLWQLDLGKADFAIAKSAPAIAGAQIRYVITVTNNGPLVYGENAIFSDTLPAGTTFSRLSGPDPTSGWVCVTPAAGTSGTVTCRHANLFSTSGPQVFGLVVNVSPVVASGAPICNTAFARSDMLDTNTGDNSATACSTIQKIIVDRGDDANVTTCSAAPNDCTLRGAINKVHLLGGTGLAIRFDPSVTQVNLTAALPALTATGTTIAGANGVPLIDGAGMASGDMFSINTSEARISDLSLVNGAQSDIHVLGGARNEIDHNFLGTPLPLAGTCAPGGVTRNSGSGVYVDSAATASGSTSVWVYDNTIACHANYGVLSFGGDDVKIGVTPDGTDGRNWIGTNSGNEVLPNGVGAGLIANGANGARRNTIQNNVIANNNYTGVWLNGTGNNNINSTASNNIARNVVLNNGVQNGAGGIYLSAGAFWNGIGGSNDGDGNLVYGNNGDAISIYDSDLNGILGNTLGAADPLLNHNTGSGVYVSNGDGNSVGGLFVLFGVLERGNTIAGNDENGVRLFNGTRNSVVTGNWIGSTGAGARRANGQSGILIDSGAYSNTVGGDTLARVNVVAGNDGSGVRMSGGATMSNTVRFNDIGVNSALLATLAPARERRTAPAARETLALPNSGYGVLIEAGAHDNSVSNGNWIADNALGGIRLASGATRNQLGPDNLLFNNASSGIELSGPATAWNVVLTSTTHHNARDGIEEWGGAHDNAWVATVAYANGGLGIDKAAEDFYGNDPTAGWPVITSAQRSAGNITLLGTSDATYGDFLSANTTRVFVFSGGLDPSGYGEGQTLEREVSTDANGVWQATFTEGATAKCYSVYKRSTGYFFSIPGFVNYDYGSEFSPSTCAPRAFLPAVGR